jgi:hypothetical protein
MIIGLKVTYLYHDVDVIKVQVTAQNTRYKGSADVYMGTDDLLEAADALNGFPKDCQDRREINFGAAGPKFAGGSVRLELYCKDLAGHTALRAVIEDDYDQEDRAQSANIFVDFEPASLDRFLSELQRVELEHRGSADLITQSI